jgi:protein phosphatase 1G
VLVDPSTLKEVSPETQGCTATVALIAWGEDAHIAVPDLSGDGRVSFFGVFDGHGGCGVARFAAKHLPKLLLATEAFRNKDYANALSASFLAVDDALITPQGREELRHLEAAGPGGVPLLVPKTMWSELEKGTTPERIASMKKCRLNEGKKDSVLVDPSTLKEVSPETQGCTATVAFIAWGEDDARISNAQLFVANAGDSRCILCRGSPDSPVRAMAMSEDHKPELPAEAERVRAGGGVVQSMPGGARVQGDLNLSRALGDFRHKQSKDVPPEKQIITAYPEVQQCCLGDDSCMLVLGCDGIWDRNDNQKLADALYAKIIASTHGPEGSLLSSLGAEVCDSSVCPSMNVASNPDFDGTGCDNMTILIVEFGDRLRKMQKPVSELPEPCAISSIVADILDRVVELDNAELGVATMPSCDVTDGRTLVDATNLQRETTESKTSLNGSECSVTSAADENSSDANGSENVGCAEQSDMLESAPNRALGEEPSIMLVSQMTASDDGSTGVLVAEAVQASEFVPEAVEGPNKKRKMDA